MVVKHEFSQLERIRKLLKDQQGTLLTSDPAKFNIPKIYLSILEHNREIERVSRGIYRLVASIDDEMFNFQVRYKSSIFSHETALYLHDLTDRTPLSYSISIPIGYHSISLNEGGHKIFYVNRELFALPGIIQVVCLDSISQPERRSMCSILPMSHHITGLLGSQADKSIRTMSGWSDRQQYSRRSLPCLE